MEKIVPVDLGIIPAALVAAGIKELASGTDRESPLDCRRSRFACDALPFMDPFPVFFRPFVDSGLMLFEIHGNQVFRVAGVVLHLPVHFIADLSPKSAVLI